MDYPNLNNYSTRSKNLHDVLKYTKPPGLEVFGYQFQYPVGIYFNKPISFLLSSSMCSLIALHWNDTFLHEGLSSCSTFPTKDSPTLRSFQPLDYLNIPTYHAKLRGLTSFGCIISIIVELLRISFSLKFVLNN